MELVSIIQFLQNRNILVTGATGFLAKIFVEKILRVQPNVKKLYLLLRAADAKSASQRFHNEVISKELFRVLKEKMGSNLNSFLSEKVTLIPGDITSENLGVKDLNLVEEMWREIDIVVNVAATTNFDERYDVSFQLNTMGAQNVLNFAKKCAKIKLLVHVSTAYVSGERAGLVLEKPFSMGEALNAASRLDLHMEKRIIQERLCELRIENATEREITLAMKKLGIQRASKYGWPNTYVFTKAMGEMLLGETKANIPIVILRPTIITGTYKEPFPGWVEGIRTIDSLMIGYGKGKLTCFLGDTDAIIDVIPADMVVNSMLAVMAANSNQLPSDEMVIYHIGSSVSNPIKFRWIQDCGERYFEKHPWIGKDGKAVIVGKMTILNSMDSFRRYMVIRYLLPLKGLEIANTAFCKFFQGPYSDSLRKFNFVMRMVELYRPYMFCKALYDDLNTEKLRMAAKEYGVETDVFFFDPKMVHWEEYFINTHFPGVVKHVMK